MGSNAVWFIFQASFRRLSCDIGNIVREFYKNPVDSRSEVVSRNVVTDDLLLIDMSVWRNDN